MELNNYEGLTRRFRSTRNEVVEPKDSIRSELEQKTAEFLAKKGKVLEVPTGVTALSDYGVHLDENGIPISGYPGIVWSVGAHRWQVFAGKRQDRPVGFADTVVDALKLQKRFTLKVNQIEGE